MMNLNSFYIHGRVINDDVLHIYNTASGIEFNACAYFIKVIMKTIPKQKDEAWMKVIIDNDYDHPVDLKVSKEEKEFVLYSSSSKEQHNIKLLKASEAIESYVDIIDININGDYLDKPKYDKTFLVFGDSTVSGYGNLGHLTDEKTLFDTDGLLGYAFLTAKEFNASMSSVNGSGWGLCFSPWTTPKRRPLLALYDKVAPLSTLPYDIKTIKPTLALISLGTNDSYYIIEGEENKTKEDLEKEFKKDYKVLLELIKRDYGNIPVIMVYGVMRERHNYQLMHEVFLENKDSFNLYEACFEGDGMGVSGHPTYISHKEISLKLIELIKVIDSERCDN